MESESFHGLRLIAHCGGGAYGDVYYCEDPSGKRMALKIVSKKKIGDHWERELKGVKNYRKITEENNPLLKIFHVGEDDDSFYYTMEAADSACPDRYVPDTLALRLQKGALSQEQIPAVVQGVFEGIKAIHDAGFTHRDIKPDNILFVNGIPKLADIGLLSSLSAAMTRLAGTLDFIPPEERSADSPESSTRNSRQRNDLYAFGKVIYCAVTGNAPNDFPSIPQNLSLTLVLKYYKQLAFQLCDKEPLRRMNSISTLEKELASIERKLIYGETKKDHWIYFCRQIKNILFFPVISAYRMTRHYWYIILPLLLATGVGAYFLFRPEPPFDLASIKTKEFRSKNVKLSMTIPAQWEFLSYKNIKERFSKLDPKNKQHQRLLAIVNMTLKNGVEYIACDPGEDLNESVVVQRSLTNDEDFLKLTDDEIRITMKQIYRKNMGLKAEIHEVKRLNIAGRSCVFIDVSPAPGKLRVNNYIFPHRTESVSIALTSKLPDFYEHRKTFETVIKTLKFLK